MAHLTKKIMRRIYFIWFARQIFNTITLKIALVFLLGWQFAAQVSVRDVVANWHFDWGVSGSYAFVESAFRNTELVVQILVLGIAVLGILLARDVIFKRKMWDGGKLFIGA